MKTFFSLIENFIYILGYYFTIYFLLLKYLNTVIDT